MAQTLVEKIVERYTVGLKPGQKVRAQDFVSVKPAHVMTHDNTGAVIPKFKQMGATRVFAPSQPVIGLDHDVQNRDAENLAKYAKIEAFCKEQGLAFFPARRGIAHQVISEEGFVLPGTLVVGSDSHSNIYGALGAVGTSVVRTDAAAIWATGETWWQVPDVVKVTFTGKLTPGVSGKDVILTLIGVYNQDEVLNCAVEFVGEGVANLSISQRQTIANMTTEWGALVGLFPYDAVLRDYLLKRAERFARRGDANPRITPELVTEFDRTDLTADPDAYYAKELTLDLGLVTPSVAGPNEVKTMLALPQIEARDVKINKAYLLSCVNGRLDDIREAAEVIKGRKISPEVGFYLAAASSEIEDQARELGYWDTLVEAGAHPLPAGCGPCIGLGEGLLEAGEVGISATNRNFKGRMGSTQASVYLSSPAVVAASAIAGKIIGPRSLEEIEPHQVPYTLVENPAQPQETGAVEILPGFPRQLTGGLLFAPKDNMNTDALYGKEYTYRDNVPPEVMAKVAMLNYDPEFQNIAQEGDILVGGWNFGTGSSREQAATALKYRGIQLVIAGSYSQIFKRNAFNNGYIVLECPGLVRSFKENYAGEKAPTIKTGIQATVDFEKSEISWEGQRYGFSPLGRVAQELVILGGFENLIQERIRQSQVS
ncbi:MAG: homoaconitase [Chloroflexi bacterium]|nr:homoaconitase [Chloroflexota bacterium]OJV91200.1 MAG: homoaconitase [Chloroflexi bacterium 54-19]